MRSFGRPLLCVSSCRLGGRLAYGLLPLATLFTVQQTTGSYASAGLALALFGLASITLPLKSRLADRHGRRRVLPLLALSCAAVLAGGASAVGLGLLRWARRALDPGPLRSAGLLRVVGVLLVTGAVISVGQTGMAAVAQSHGRPGAAGLLEAGLGAGSVLGGLLWARRRHTRPRSRHFAGLLAVFGTGLLAAAAAPGLIALGVVMSLAGVAIAPLYVVAYPAADDLAPPGHATEAGTWINVASNAGSALGAAAAGVVIDGLGPSPGLPRRRCRPVRRVTGRRLWTTAEKCRSRPLHWYPTQAGGVRGRRITHRRQGIGFLRCPHARSLGFQPPLSSGAARPWAHELHPDVAWPQVTVDQYVATPIAAPGTESIAISDCRTTQRRA